MMLYGERYSVPRAPGFSQTGELAMLCRDGSFEAIDAEDLWIVQLKHDGIRGICVDGQMLTREGGPLACANHVVPALDRLAQAMGRPMVFDGEYVEHGGFCDTLAAFRKGAGEGVFHIFDAVPLEDWIADNCAVPIEQRINAIPSLADHADSPFVALTRTVAMNPHNVRANAAEAWADGKEGLVAKRPGSLYRRRRSTDWLRLKETRTGTFPIIDMLVKGGALKSVLVRTPWGTTRISRGWTVDAGRALHNGWIAQRDGRPQLLATLSYQLSTGTRRTLRGVQLIDIKHDGDI